MSTEVQYYCCICSYVKPVRELENAKHIIVEPCTPKKVDDVFGDSVIWQHQPKTEIDCPQADCGGKQAYYQQIQIRSWDEPMTTFYRCALCKEIWRHG